VRIVRQNETEIVVEDSTLATAAVSGVIFLVLFPLGLALRWYSISCVSAPALVFALLRLRRTSFAFNAESKSVQWTRLSPVRREAGSIPFSDVQDVVIETKNPGNSSYLCRLLIRTATSSIPIRMGYSVRQDQATTIRATLLDFISAGAAAKPPSATNTINTDADRTQQLNDSIRSLLLQGKKIDAILLVQRSEHLDLTEATFRVNQIANQLGTRQSAPKA
jgi:hypothetical protein